MDYEGDGNFRDNYNGKDGELAEKWPGLSSTNRANTGIPIFPVNFGSNAHFWILDSPQYEFGVRYVWFMQGTNILATDEEKSSIYSTRAVVLGGALIRTTTSHTTDGLNRDLNGFADKSLTTEINYVEATVRYSQLIYNTDIILMPPPDGSPSEGKTAYSQIRRPNSWRSRTNLTTGTSDTAIKVFDKDTGYEPTMTIAGGTIYVGNRQHLTIQGTSMGYKTGADYKKGVQSGSGWVALDNMWISPDKIVVDAGGTLLIEASAATNILTDIYVDGGTLIINEGAKIKGNIYAYNGGKVNIRGSFKLFSPHDDGNDNVMTEDEAKDGILIYGDQLVGKVDGITSSGILLLPSVYPNFVEISGSSNKVHILGTVDGTIVKGLVQTKDSNGVITKETPWEFDAGGLKAIKEAKSLLCMGRDPATGSCTHYPFTSGEWGERVFGYD
jgi:hypothetical protein